MRSWPIRGARELCEIVQVLLTESCCVLHSVQKLVAFPAALAARASTLLVSMSSMVAYAVDAIPAVHVSTFQHTNVFDSS